MQKIVQIENVSLEELVEKVRTIVLPAPVTAVNATSVMITVLNKRDAAKTLNISESLFDKLHAKGIIPLTVYAGVNNKGDVILRWAQHHLIAIKPVVTRLRYKHSEDVYMQAKREIKNILGL